MFFPVILILNKMCVVLLQIVNEFKVVNLVEIVIQRDREPRNRNDLSQYEARQKTNWLLQGRSTDTS